MNRKYWDRKEKKYKEEVAPSEEKLKFLYTTIRGRFLLKCIFARRWFAVVGALYYNSSLSKCKVTQLDVANEFKSYNDYFSRKEKRHSNAKTGELIAPADSRVSVYKIDENLKLPIKGGMYSIRDLVDDEQIVSKFSNGLCLIYRLTLEDYHRYVYIDNGILSRTKKIKGMLHTVRPIEGSKENYFRNSREVSYFDFDMYGETIQIEIGAMLVGKIVNHKKSGFVDYMEEKGYFEYGGSTIVQIFKKDTIVIDKDIVDMSLEGIEVKVEIGEKVGRCLKG